MLKHEVLDEDSLRALSPVVLAYIGDAVYELFVRTRVALAGPHRIKDLHLSTIGYVNAQSQARIVKAILPTLSVSEQDLVRRGRNAKSTAPKNANPADYNLSTGFEALIGYLYLKGDEERLFQLVNQAYAEHDRFNSSS